MVNLLVVDDEVKIREMIKKYATYENFKVDEAENGFEAIEKCRLKSYDVIVMDIMMPDLDGFSAAKEIKKMKDIPIILLSARGEEYDKVHGFEIGVDDYVVKPFSSKELMMRIHSLYRRYNKNKADINTFDDLSIDFDARNVFVEGEKVNLSFKEFELLSYLIQNQGKVVSRESLLQQVWGYDFYGDDRTLDTHIKLLRKNLKGCATYIVTVRGVGYKFEKPN